VSDLFVDTDAGRTRETVAKLGSRRGPCSFQKTSTELIQLARRHSWLDGRSHCGQCVGDNAADLLEPVELIIA